MAHKTLINGTAYNVVGGSTLINGAAANIVKGNTLIDGTSYSIAFQSSSGWEWPGWDNATWEDLNNLCIQKQEGIISSYPSDVVIGNTKDNSGNTCYLIGIDIDQAQGGKAGTLTFFAKPNSGTTWGSSGTTTYAASRLLSNTQSWGNSTEVAPYAIYLRKTVKTSTSSSASPSCKFWNPSVSEYYDENYSYDFGSEYTYDGQRKPYPGLTRSLGVPDSSYMWTRSYYKSKTANRIYISSSGSFGNAAVSSTYKYCLCFAIGNPEASTL